MNRPQAVTVRAYSSLSNLGYGFDVMGMSVDVGFDEVLATRDGGCCGILATRDGGGLEIVVSGEVGGGISSDPDQNTAGLAAGKVIEHGRIEENVRLEIRKGIRPGSGLGSSAASAVAAVVAVDALFGLKLSQEELVRFAAEGERASAGNVHADNVAPALMGGLILCSRQMPLQFYRVSVPAGLRFVVSRPDMEIKTAAARAALPRSIGLDVYSEGCWRCAAMVAALHANDIRMFGELVEGSFVDQCRSRAIPGWAAVRDAARSGGAYGVMISGSGPAVAAVADDSLDCVAIRDAMTDAFERSGLRAESHVAKVSPGATVIEVRR